MTFWFGSVRFGSVRFRGPVPADTDGEPDGWPSNDQAVAGAVDREVGAAPVWHDHTPEVFQRQAQVASGRDGCHDGRAPETKEARSGRGARGTRRDPRM